MKIGRSHLEALQIAVISVFAATVLLVSFLVKRHKHRNTPTQSLDLTRQRAARIGPRPTTQNKAVTRMEQQAKSNQLQKPSQQTKPPKAQATLVQPTLSPSSRERGHAREKFDMGTYC